MYALTSDTTNVSTCGYQRVTKIRCPELGTKKTADFHKPTAQLINYNLTKKLNYEKDFNLAISSSV